MKGGPGRCAIIALIIVFELSHAGFAIGVAASAGAGLSSTVTVLIDGATGEWTPAPSRSSAAAPTTTGTAAQTPTAPPDALPDQSAAPTTPSTSEATSTTPAAESSGSSEPDPVTP